MIDNLDRLNRKERYFLIGMALGNPTFKLSSYFLEALIDKFQLVIPDKVFVAMDYHLNWIAAAAALCFNDPIRDHLYLNTGDMIDGTQEDVDLLLAFDDQPNLTHLIMLEAKGVTAFNNSQFEHKMNRFRNIFGNNCEKWPQIKPYFGLVSPRKPEKLRVDSCPPWLMVNGEIPWLEMPIPDNRLVLFGCDENGRANQDRQYWTIRHQ